MGVTLFANTEDPNSAYSFKLPGVRQKGEDDSGFDGSLELLLYLIKKDNINIYDIPIAQITEQYLKYVSFSTEIDLDDLTDFHVMAATLLYIKSRMLLPVEIDDDEEIEDPRQELVDKLIEYQKFKKLSQLMVEKEEEAEWAIERKKIQRILPFDDDGLWQQANVLDLLKTFSAMMSHLTSEQIMDLREETSINEKTTLMLELIERKGECTFTELLIRKGSLMDIVCAFLAILEAVKFRRIRIFQNRLFGDISIREYKSGCNIE
ncbi:segregation and condensation protein A [Spirochaetia bacterium]|nr:segregation and condensation protein A [Spirochaetia bacterium]